MIMSHTPHVILLGLLANALPGLPTLRHLQVTQSLLRKRASLKELFRLHRLGL